MVENNKYSEYFYSEAYSDSDRELIKSVVEVFKGESYQKCKDIVMQSINELAHLCKKND